MTVDMERMGLTVLEVKEGRTAEFAGVLPKDRIIAIGNRTTRYLPLAEAKKFLQKKSPKDASLIIERDILLQRE